MTTTQILPIFISVIFASISWGFVGYLILKNKFPGRGLQVIKNIFKESVSFEEALKALKVGMRIRRKNERKGFTKVILLESNNKTEKYGTYWASDDKKNISEHCSFSIEDVLATDWIIDE